jgi:hypothetical protein
MSSYLGFNLSPGSNNYSATYGGNVGNVDAPPSTYQQAASVYSGLSGLTSQAGGVLSSELSGQLSPTTMTNIWNSAAARGVTLGQPNSSISNEIGLSLTGNTSEQLQQQGLSGYNNFLSGLSSTQLDPSLLTGIAEQNAVNNAAPQPASANAEAQQLFQQYEQSMQTPQGGSYSGYNPSGNTGAYSGGNPYGAFGNIGGFGSMGTGNTGSNFGYSSGIGPVISTYGNDNNNWYDDTAGGATGMSTDYYS